MQQKTDRISNQDRSQATVTALLSAARRLFVKKGYANTGTPEIVAAAKVTRGALYHHFENKAGLFLAVARQVADEVANEIDSRSRGQKRALDALIRGAEAYFSAMSERGRARLLLVDAPSILSPIQLEVLSDKTGSRELHAGLLNLLQVESGSMAPIEELTTLLSASFDRAALAVANGAPAARYQSAMRLLLTGLASEAAASKDQSD